VEALIIIGMFIGVPLVIAFFGHFARDSETPYEK